MVCMHCGRKIAFRPGRGWFHLEGGGMYWMKCESCGWEGSCFPSPTSCPQCGATRSLRDDHIATPDYSRKGVGGLRWYR